MALSQTRLRPQHGSSSSKPLSNRVAYKARTAAKAPKTPATVMPTRTLSELAADEEDAAAVPEAVEDPVAPEAPVEVPDALTAPEEEPVAPDAVVAPDPVAVAAVPVAAGVDVTRTAEEARQLRWQTS